MKAYPFLVDEDATGRRLVPVGSHEHHFDEAWLQGLLERHPDILPVGEIESVFSSLVSLGREIPTSSGPIDNLFISRQGYPVLVETKLWRNPEARREVVAQAIDYGSALSKWSYSDLDAAVLRQSRINGGSAVSLIDLVEHQCGPVEEGREYFKTVVDRNLRLGRFLIAVVTDKVRQPFADLIAYVNQFPGLSTNIAVIELECFWPETSREWPLFVVPRIVAQTVIVERTVVEVTVSPQPAAVEIRQEKSAVSDRRSLRGVSITEEAFWEWFRDLHPLELENARGLMAFFEKLPGASIVPTESSLSVRLDAPASGRAISLFFLSKDAAVNVWPGTIKEQLMSSEIDPDLADEYSRNLGSFIAPSKSGHFHLHVGGLDVKRFEEVVRAFVESVQQSHEE